jgi:hypothetical protein
MWMAIASLGAVLVACGDGTGPDTAGSVRAAVHRSQPSGVDTTYVPAPLRFAPWAPPLETYDTTFTLVQGTASADTIFFRPRAGETERELFMVLAVPATARFVDAAGRPLASGSTVFLTVKVDDKLVKLDFGPHGSTFTTKPARLSIWWQNTDLQGRSGSGLELWYQPTNNKSWSALATQVSTAFTWLVADLYHFSNYAVAY